MKPTSKRQHTVVKDFSEVRVVKKNGKKPLTGADPVLLELIRQAVKNG
jgi:hypothetical protein